MSEREWGGEIFDCTYIRTRDRGTVEAVARVGEDTTECVARRPRGHIPVNMIGFYRTDGKDIIIIT